jgi:hypothetical protein
MLSCGHRVRMIDASLGYPHRGYRPVPVKASTKKALGRWTEHEDRTPTDAETQGWWAAFSAVTSFPNPSHANKWAPGTPSGIR